MISAVASAATREMSASVPPGGSSMSSSELAKSSAGTKALGMAESSSADRTKKAPAAAMIFQRLATDQRRAARYRVITGPSPWWTASESACSEYAASTGVISRATSSEKKTAAATVRPNCRKYCPVTPSMKLTGRNTAMIVNDVATTARPISSAASMAARKPLLPMRMCLTMFSISTMASSTSTPATSDRPSSVTPFSVNPMACMKAKVGTADSGIASAEMTVARQLRRNIQTTITARVEPSSRVLIDE